jgi:hypothetical protein
MKTWPAQDCTHPDPGRQSQKKRSLQLAKKGRVQKSNRSFLGILKDRAAPIPWFHQKSIVLFNFLQ